MKYFAQGFIKNCEENLVSPLGTDYQRIISGLKTLRGVIRRVDGMWWPDKVVEIRIYSYTNLYDVETYKLVNTRRPKHAS